MFDSYNFGHTVSPEVGGSNPAGTPGDSPKVEDSFATFEENSPFGPASPQPKVIFHINNFIQFFLPYIPLNFWSYFNRKQLNIQEVFFDSFFLFFHHPHEIVKSSI